jgi:hypothetical protein
VKRIRLLQLLQRHGCVLKGEGGSHSIWRNPVTNKTRQFHGIVRSARTSLEKFAGSYRFLIRINTLRQKPCVLNKLPCYVGELLARALSPLRLSKR